MTDTSGELSYWVHIEGDVAASRRLYNVPCLSAFADE